MIDVEVDPDSLNQTNNLILINQRISKLDIAVSISHLKADVQSDSPKKE